MAALNFPSSPAVNDIFTSNGKTYLWNGSSWVNTSSGFTGSLGFTGSIGFTGSQGTAGTNGFTGSRGFTGSIGFTGSQGTAGTNGFTGSIGFTGFTGSLGFTGSIGVTGFSGSRGFTGSIGFTGSKGTDGVAVGSIYFVIDGGSANITSGVKGDLSVPFNATINEWTMLSDLQGNITMDIWGDTYANYPPTVADTITGTDKPRITNALKGQSTALTGWSTTLTAGNTLRFNVDSANNVQRVTLILKVTKT
jgi:hypothetical protein